MFVPWNFLGLSYGVVLRGCSRGMFFVCFIWMFLWGCPLRTFFCNCNVEIPKNLLLVILVEEIIMLKLIVKDYLDENIAIFSC